MRSHILRAILALLVAAMATSARAQVVEHQATNYTIHVDSLNLQGHETAMDILLMCPDLISANGTDPLQSSLYGKYGFKIDGMDLVGGFDAVLSHLRASEIKSITVEEHAGVTYGYNGLKQLLNIRTKLPAQGTTGNHNVEANSYGTLSTYHTMAHQQNNVYTSVIAEGSVGAEHRSGMPQSHFLHSGAKAYLGWQATRHDLFRFDIKHNFDRNHVRQPTAQEYDRQMRVDAAYKRQLHPNGAEMTLKFVGKHATSHTNGRRSHSVDPYTYAEFDFPLVHHKVWITAGLEAGWGHAEEERGGEADKYAYEDLYFQADIELGRWMLSLGDRFRLQNHWRSLATTGQSSLAANTTHNYYTAALLYHLSTRSTLQATVARRFYEGSPDWEGPMAQVGLAPRISDREILTTELKYTYSTPKLIVSPVAKLLSQEVDVAGATDRTLSVGTTAWACLGRVRLTAGFNYFWQAYAQGTGHGNRHFAQIKLSPQCELGRGWKAVATGIYNTHQAAFTGNPYSGGIFHPQALVPATLLAQVRIEKAIGRQWLFLAGAQHLAHQHYGRRSATLGVTYYW